MTTQDIVTELSKRVTDALAKRDAEIVRYRNMLNNVGSVLRQWADEGLSPKQIGSLMGAIMEELFPKALAAETVAQQVVRELERVDASEGARSRPCFVSGAATGSPLDPDMSVTTGLDARLANAAPGEAVEITQAEFAMLKARPQKIAFREYGSQEPARAMTDEEIAEMHTPKGPATFCTCPDYAEAHQICAQCRAVEAKMVLPIPASQSGACVAPVVGPCTMHGHEFTPLDEFNETPLCEVCGGTYPTEIAK